MKKILLLLLPICCTATIYAQLPTDASAIIEALNARIAGIGQGYFSVNARFKFANEEDTIAHSGTCYFFRDFKNADSLARFVVLHENKPVYAFDGENFYLFIESEKKVHVVNTLSGGGANRVMRSNIQMDNLIFKNFLYDGRPPFHPSGFDTTVITAFRIKENSFLRLTLRDTFVEQVFGDVPNNKIILTYHYDIALPDFYLANMSSEVWLFDGWQYERKDFSAIVPLPSTATWNDYFDPKKLSAEYEFEQFDPRAPVKREIELIKTGEILPDFMLTNLEGEQFPLSSQQDGLLLLDFWYKGCFPCQLAMPGLERLHQKYAAKGLRMLGINPLDKNAEVLRDWLKSRNITYPTLLDTEGKLAAKLGVSGYPLLLVADARSKKVIHVHTGFSETMEAELESLILEHLK
ncbi:MAG: hypothetical protein OHK0019_14910 [Saprospiraceae bacterium]